MLVTFRVKMHSSSAGHVDKKEIKQTNKQIKQNKINENKTNNSG